jgi:hypothetical protein
LLDQAIRASIAKTSIAHNMGDTSSRLPWITLINVQLRNPQMIPCVILNVSGISSMAINAGMALSISLQEIFRTGFIMKTPTKTRAGAVAIPGIIESKGDRNINGRKRSPATRAVRPVLPPSSIPVADSI